MMLPHAEDAIVDEAKITRYLLNINHMEARDKAKFFLGHGFSPDSWRDMAAALRDHARTHPVARLAPNPQGLKYVIEGIMLMPDGQVRRVRSVWIIHHGDSTPILVTSYPIRGGE